jgi:hypothetical protein
VGNLVVYIPGLIISMKENYLKKTKRSLPMASYFYAFRQKPKKDSRLVVLFRIDIIVSRLASNSLSAILPTRKEDHSMYDLLY